MRIKDEFLFFCRPTCSILFQFSDFTQWLTRFAVLINDYWFDRTLWMNRPVLPPGVCRYQHLLMFTIWSTFVRLLDISTVTSNSVHLTRSIVHGSSVFGHSLSHSSWSGLCFGSIMVMLSPFPNAKHFSTWAILREGCRWKSVLYPTLLVVVPRLKADICYR